MDKELTENKPYQNIGQFTEIKITSKKYSSKLLTKIHPFYDENWRMCKILFSLMII